MTVIAKWFGFDRTEILDEGISLFERAEYDEAREAFLAFLSESEDGVATGQAQFYLRECDNRLGAVGRVYVA